MALRQANQRNNLREKQNFDVSFNKNLLDTQAETFDDLFFFFQNWWLYYNAVFKWSLRCFSTDL